MSAERIEATAAEPEKQDKRFEVMCGIVIALFAAILAINDLGAGKFGDDELIAYNQKNNAYLWYQTKGIKETLVEEQRNTLQALVAAGSIRPEQLPTVENLIKTLDEKAGRYGRQGEDRDTSGLCRRRPGELGAGRRWKAGTGDGREGV